MPASTSDHCRNAAAQVRAVRIACKKTQEDLAQQADVSLGSVRRFEQDGEISLQSLVRILNALNAIELAGQLFRSAAEQADKKSRVKVKKRTPQRRFSRSSVDNDPTKKSEA